ncbi:translation initiation factor IF-2-like [Lutra lutra]|uniref:translation initiation factor IF-2-like n=1 Tax=Lutra lutra TaxID=9657 RepID=UPI001FD575C0|nr:translation initiation factor IF-2-like [Lutra lutra]
MAGRGPRRTSRPARQAPRPARPAGGSPELCTVFTAGSPRALPLQDGNGQGFWVSPPRNGKSQVDPEPGHFVTFSVPRSATPALPLHRHPASSTAEWAGIGTVGSLPVAQLPARPERRGGARGRRGRGAGAGGGAGRSRAGLLQFPPPNSRLPRESRGTGAPTAEVRVPAARHPGTESLGATPLRPTRAPAPQLQPAPSCLSLPSGPAPARGRCRGVAPARGRPARCPFGVRSPLTRDEDALREGTARREVAAQVPDLPRPGREAPPRPGPARPGWKPRRPESSLRASSLLPLPPRPAPIGSVALVLTVAAVPAVSLAGRFFLRLTFPVCKMGKQGPTSERGTTALDSKALNAVPHSSPGLPSPEENPSHFNWCPGQEAGGALSPGSDTL